MTNEEKQLAEFYEKKWKESLQEIEQLQKRLAYYTDQSWELDTLRQQSYERDRYEWK